MTRGVSWIRRLAVLVYLALGAGAVGALALGVLTLVAVEDLPRVPSPLSRIIETANYRFQKWIKQLPVLG